MSALGAVVAVFILNGIALLFRAKTRRSLILRWVEDQGWTLISCRSNLNPLGWSWLASYKIEVLDRTGHPLEGTAYATGFIRRKVWADW